MSRRAKGEGSIYQLRDGRWTGLVWVDGPGGQPRRRRVNGATKGEVASRFKELRAAVDEGLNMDMVGGRRGGVTIGELAELWFAKQAKVRKAPSTLSRVRDRLDVILLPALGDVVARDLRVEQVDRWLTIEAAKGKARRTLEDYRSLLGEVLEWAIARKSIPAYNAARYAAVPADAKEPAEKRVLTGEQAHALLTTLRGDRWGAYFTMILMLGLRPGEADALTWDRIDWQAGTVYIDRALQRSSDGRGIALAGTKTKTTRLLSLPPEVLAALRERQAVWQDERKRQGRWWTTEWPADLVFSTELGTPALPSNLRRDLAKACHRAGIDPISPYELRHTAASLLVAGGARPHEVADLLGHVDTRMLDRHYRHKLVPLVPTAIAMSALVVG